jgi:hypothetical protein
MRGRPKRAHSKGLDRVIDTLQAIGTFFYLASMAWVVVGIVLLLS